MDRHTLELLEFDKIRKIVASYAACSLGKESALRMEPSRELSEIHEQQAYTTEMAEALSAHLAPPFGGVHDIRAHVRRAQTGAMLAADELAETAEVLRAISGIHGWFARINDQFMRLGALQHGIGEFSALANAIEGCLDSRGNVLDTASRRLSAIRREVGQVEDQIQATLRRMLRSPELRRILRFPNFTMVGHHYVLPIAKDHRGEIQGSVHRTSASNETVYIEPLAIGEQSAQLSFLRAREAKEIRRILRWLSAQVGQVADALLGSLETLAELDLIFARGRYSLEYGMSAPDMNRDGPLVLRSARHPLLEYLFREEGQKHARQARPAEEPAAPAAPEIRSEPPHPAAATEAAPHPLAVVPIDVQLGLRFRILVVTGPNTGGKTVALKTAGLLAVMGQCGLHIPAGEGSQLPVFDQVLADIGDEQSLEQSLSTFSSHILRISEIFARATDRSLVLLDELGAGTDPTEGAALGRAILDELDRLGCLAIVTTHIGDLKTYALTNARAENAAVAFDVESLRPLYKLELGDIGQSNALQIARRLRLPEHLVARAAGYLERGRGPDLPELEILQALRKEADQAREAALRSQAEAERSRDALNLRLAELQRQTEQDARLAEARDRLQPGDRVVVPRFGYDRPGRVVRVDARKRMAVVSIGQMQWDVPIAELIPQAIRTPPAPDPPAPTARRPAPRAPGLDQFDGPEPAE